MDEKVNAVMFFDVQKLPLEVLIYDVGQYAYNLEYSRNCLQWRSLHHGNQRDTGSVSEALPKLQDRIRCSVDPVWAAAIGAAKLAGHIILTPSFFYKAPVDLGNGELASSFVPVNLLYEDQ